MSKEQVFDGKSIVKISPDLINFILKMTDNCILIPKTEKDLESNLFVLFSVVSQKYLSRLSYLLGKQNTETETVAIC